MGSSETRCGIITDNAGSLLWSRSLPQPICSPQSILVKVRAVALNPVDVKMPPAIAKRGLLAGNDFSGEVVEIGSEVHSVHRPGCAPWSVGDRVCGAVLGCNPKKPTSGSFADLIEADPVTMARIPEDWSWEKGAALGGCCVGAVGLALFRNLKLELPPAARGAVPGRMVAGGKRDVVLVYGGSTACGTVALQLLRL
jgi:aspyridone synthetase trans-acting enoyl reductase